VAICSRKQLDEEKSSLEKGMARLEARYEASLQQLTDREEVSQAGDAEQGVVG
jgi:flagellar motility protein MotE (MotC chaperone)